MLPADGSYIPMPSFTPLTAPCPAPILGAIAVKTKSGVSILAGTGKKSTFSTIYHCSGRILAEKEKTILLMLMLLGLSLCLAIMSLLSTRMISRK